MLVQDIMRSPAVAIAPDTTLEDAYRTMREKGFRHLPVLESGRLVGVVTDRDLRLATSSLAPSPFPPGSRVAGGHEPRTPDGRPARPGGGRRADDAREEDRLPSRRRERHASSGSSPGSTSSTR